MFHQQRNQKHHSDYCEQEKACQLKVHKKIFLGHRRSGFAHTRYTTPKTRKEGFFFAFSMILLPKETIPSFLTIRDQRPRGIYIETVFFTSFYQHIGDNGSYFSPGTVQNEIIFHARTREVLKGYQSAVELSIRWTKEEDTDYWYYTDYTGLIFQIQKLEQLCVVLS